MRNGFRANGKAQHALKVPLFFKLCGGGRFLSFFLYSQHVPFNFPMCSSRVFPITPSFNPIRFAQSPPLLAYIGGPNREALHLSKESSILGSVHSFNFFCDGPIKLVHCKRKKVELVKPPQTNAITPSL